MTDKFGISIGVDLDVDMQNGDTSDSRELGISSFLGLNRPKEAELRIPKDSDDYDMSHKNRGVALIFVHKQFVSSLRLGDRSGAEQDANRLQETFNRLGYKVIMCADFWDKQIQKKLQEVSEMDHTENDSLVVAVSTHGDLGILYAQDRKYAIENLWTPFTGDQCKTLIGKPKMFFIQACQGDKLDDGVYLKSLDMYDGPKQYFTIPNYADILIAYSTFSGFYSWRNSDNGSWYVRALCEKLNERASRDDIVTILTAVSRAVAYDYQSNCPTSPHMHARKQQPSFTSLLTRRVFFGSATNGAAAAVGGGDSASLAKQFNHVL